MARKNFKVKPVALKRYSGFSQNHCQIKQKYDSQQKAIAVANDQNRLNLDTNLKPYFCSNCGYWHLTSHNKKLSDML